MANSQLKAVADFMRLYDRNALAYSIRAAVQIGILEALEDGQKDLQQLSELTSTKPEVLELLMNVMVNTELIERYGDLFALSTVARLIPQQFFRFWGYSLVPSGKLPAKRGVVAGQ